MYPAVHRRLWSIFRRLTASRFHSEWDRLAWKWSSAYLVELEQKKGRKPNDWAHLPLEGQPYSKVNQEKSVLIKIQSKKIGKLFPGQQFSNR